MTHTATPPPRSQAGGSRWRRLADTLLSIRFCRDGITFIWYGDDVMWLFPCSRISGKPFISFGFDAAFNSLREIYELWQEYFDVNS